MEEETRGSREAPRRSGGGGPGEEVPVIPIMHYRSSLTSVSTCRNGSVPFE